jgi:hypothetical protein
MTNKMKNNWSTELQKTQKELRKEADEFEKTQPHKPAPCVTINKITSVDKSQNNKKYTTYEYATTQKSLEISHCTSLANWKRTYLIRGLRRMERTTTAKKEVASEAYCF